jgi:hypothetical protein
MLRREGDVAVISVISCPCASAFSDFCMIRFFNIRQLLLLFSYL